jgi:transcriptional regulator with XRE-family HTH domain
MSIGATLAKARLDAGLTVAQVSERTRIRETIIRGIEQDDYSACGGDFYARGHVRSIASVVGADPASLIGEYDATLRAPEEITAAEALRPTMPIRAVARRRPNWTAILAVALVAVIGFVGYLLVSAPSHGPAAATGFRPAHRHAGHAAAHPQPALTHAATPRATPSTTPSVPPVTSLAPVSAAAFGPGGTAQGDNPRAAPLAVAGHPATPWHTSWYATARFGNLRTGTGLLLDMGRPVTITSARITLGSTPGADIELRAGNVPALADLPTVARATNAGGAVQLRPTRPVRGRYLLIWFTLLPPDSSGTYQADISDVRLRGRA